MISAEAPSKLRRGLDGIARAYRAKSGESYGQRLLSNEVGIDLIRGRLVSPEALLVGRLGATEQAAFRRYMWVERLVDDVLPDRSRESALRYCYGPALANDLQSLSGFFPPTPANIHRFCRLYRDDLEKADLLAVWFNRGEPRLVRRYVSAASLVPLSALCPVFSSEPWTLGLAGQRVLVIHPFAETIRSQLGRLDSIFERPFWPQCELSVVPAVQSLGGDGGGWHDWFQALDHMVAAIAASDCDVVLVGAGAYGLPLAAAAKDLGKKAVLVGGALQLFFGIRGKRWDDRPDYRALINSAWVRPKEAERPSSAAAVEDACYW